MRKSVLSGLIAGALTIGAGICPPSGVRSRDSE